MKNPSTVSGTELEQPLALNGGPRALTAEAPVQFHAPGLAEVGEEEIAAVTDVLRRQKLFRYSKLAEGSYVSQMEELFREKTQVEYALAVNSGTSALMAGLIGIGVGQGDEVLVPAYTYIATAAAVLNLGAFPVVVEIDHSFTMDPVDLRKKITPRAKAVIPVHMRGTPCDMIPILEVAREHNLKVLEDVSQANGGFYRGKPLGSWGDVGTFSMMEAKMITSGEGGVVTTHDKEVYDRAAIYHDSAYAFWMEGQGTEEERQHWKEMCFLGQNFRQSELHGALGLEQLKKRDTVLSRTRWIKSRLREVCRELPGTELEHSHDEEGDCGINLAVLRESSAEALRLAELLSAEGVRCGTRFSKEMPDRHFWYHWDYILEKRTPHSSGFPWRGVERDCQVEYSQELCPQTLDLAERSVVFPIIQTMSDRYVDEMCLAIRKVARNL